MCGCGNSGMSCKLWPKTVTHPFTTHLVEVVFHGGRQQDVKHNALIFFLPVRFVVHVACGDKRLTRCGFLSACLSTFPPSEHKYFIYIYNIFLADMGSLEPTICL